MGRLEGRVALVTGAASGLGAACARRFAEEGARVVGLDLRDADDWDAIEKLAPAAGFHVADVTDEDAVAAAVRAVVDGHGRLDVLANAAGVAGGGPVHLLDAAAWDRVLN